MRCLVLAAALCFAVPAIAQDDAAALFVHTASTGNIFEIESSQLALQRTHNPAIRDYAQTVIDDHTRASARLQAALGASGLQPDMALDAGHQADIAALTNATPQGFDALYLELQAHAHEDAIAAFGDYARSGKAPALQGFAHDELPGLQDHLSQIETIAQNTATAKTTGG